MIFLTFVYPVFPYLVFQRLSIW